MEGIIKLVGQVSDIVYQRDSCITITLHYAELCKKGAQEVAYGDLELFPGQKVDIPYSGPVHLSEPEVAKFAFGPEITHGTYGYGSKTSDIRRSHLVNVYIHWRRILKGDDKYHTVIDHVVVGDKTPPYDDFTVLVEKIAANM